MGQMTKKHRAKTSPVRDAILVAKMNQRNKIP